MIFSEAISRFDDLVEAIEVFNGWWPAHVVFAEAYPVPLLTKALAPKAIDVGHLAGDPAVHEATHLIAQFERAPGQDARTVVRLPGIVALDTPLMAILDEVNARKSALKAFVHANVPTEERVEFHAAVFPGCSALQIYRQIPTLRFHPRRIGMTWAGKTHAITKIKPDEAKRQLKDYSEAFPGELDDAAWSNVLEREYALIDNLGPDQVLRRREPIAPHPRALIYAHGQYGDRRPDAAPGKHRRGWQKMLHVNLPIFFWQPPGQGRPVIKPLKSWTAARSARQPDLPIVGAVAPSCHLVIARRPRSP